ncbi:MAG TPA: ATP-binding protein [Candidatus Avoscillospira avistercoris]|uniref:ATP-binding protein n=1 Tax=Candidatus Avoscillospira avistercoris TaxID=2840707 RepID=A0A9D1FA09_9FIRM|nr:ATP-binding protein [Candidatus Avoscillospira avistercoris]
MESSGLTALAHGLSAFTVFRGLLAEPGMAALRQFLLSGDLNDRLDSYGRFVAALAGDEYCLDAYLRRLIFSDENAVVVHFARTGTVAPAAAANARAELSILSTLSALTAEDLWAGIEYSGYLPRYETHGADFREEYNQRLLYLGRYGYGIFSTAAMFRIDGTEIVPVESADEITLDRFVGYEAERQKVLQNTIALLEGRPAANVLLCGDAGTGKSSTVKACVNELSRRGLRLIELRKDQLYQLPMVLGRIRGNPLKFILFIDDLSFNQNDDCFSMLKAALEGSASAKAPNAVIYATSNRRHIVKERFSERETGDDIHRNDTLQELLSLSERFGLTVYFERPNKSLYLDIVHRLAERCGIDMDQTDLDREAEAFALRRGSRSARAAEQFINSMRT